MTHTLDTYNRAQLQTSLLLAIAHSKIKVKASKEELLVLKKTLEAWVVSQNLMDADLELKAYVQIAVLLVQKLQQKLMKLESEQKISFDIQQALMLQVMISELLMNDSLDAYTANTLNRINYQIHKQA
ncbi:MAG: hypothetical protein PHG67_06050 [Bacteroidales bacterium]|jgi:serine phosphatase RsbU (regulator of sigma subunit)|nr:hypothetical protein [Bacteroidales bacterium]HOI31202.1 hypothetical protein [Bacteroidales bacterium]